MSICPRPRPRPAGVTAAVPGCQSICLLAGDDACLLLPAEVVVATLRGDGSVLIPVDAAGRMLEVALLLEEFWDQEK